MTSLIAAVVEAWSEVRVHRSRFVLSLLGVYLAVFAMTSIAGLGAIGQQMLLEATEGVSGRAATIKINANATEGNSREQIRQKVRDIADKHEVTWVAEEQHIYTNARGADKNTEVLLRAVNNEYRTVHRVSVLQGRWFDESDEKRLAPTVIVNRAFLDKVGASFTPGVPSQVTLFGVKPVTATVIGVSKSASKMPMAFIQDAAKERWGIGGSKQGGNSSEYSASLWIPAEMADEAEKVFAREAQAFGGMVNRGDFGGELAGVFSVMTWSVRIVGWFGLLLGGLGVFNIAMVTVRQRIREIGVRRSFGSTTRRVFATVLLENTCATAVAGALAVISAVLLVTNLPMNLLLERFDVTVTDIPPFPYKVALEGFLAATFVGTAAGFLPALTAVRSKVVDAIRY